MTPLKKSLIYIAGPYRDNRGEYYVGENIRKAREVMLELIEQGYYPFCPHTHSAFCNGAFHGMNSIMPGAPSPDYVWLEIDKRILSHCDAIVMLPGWEHSEGSSIEFKFAKEHRIPIYRWENDTLYERLDL